MELTDLLCDSCRELRKEVNEVKKIAASNFRILREKIISTDAIIEKYHTKNEECNKLTERITALTSLIEQLNSDIQQRDKQLKEALQDLEPLTLAKQDFLKRQKEFISQAKLQEEKLEAAEKLRQQLELTLKFQEQKEKEMLVKNSELNLELKNLNGKMGMVCQSGKDEDYKNILENRIKYMTKTALALGKRLQKQNVITAATRRQIVGYFKNPCWKPVETKNGKSRAKKPKAYKDSSHWSVMALLGIEVEDGHVFLNSDAESETPDEDEDDEIAGQELAQLFLKESPVKSTTSSPIKLTDCNEIVGGRSKKSERIPLNKLSPLRHPKNGIHERHNKSVDKIVSQGNSSSASELEESLSDIFRSEIFRGQVVSPLPPSPKRNRVSIEDEFADSCDDDAIGKTFTKVPSCPSSIGEFLPLSDDSNDSCAAEEKPSDDQTLSLAETEEKLELSDVESVGTTPSLPNTTEKVITIDPVVAKTSENSVRVVANNTVSDSSPVKGKEIIHDLVISPEKAPSPEVSKMSEEVSSADDLVDLQSNHETETCVSLTQNDEEPVQTEFSKDLTTEEQVDFVNEGVQDAPKILAPSAPDNSSVTDNEPQRITKKVDAQESCLSIDSGSCDHNAELVFTESDSEQKFIPNNECKDHEETAIETSSVGNCESSSEKNDLLLKHDLVLSEVPDTPAHKETESVGKESFVSPLPKDGNSTVLPEENESTMIPSPVCSPISPLHATPESLKEFIKSNALQSKRIVHRKLFGGNIANNKNSVQEISDAAAATSPPKNCENASNGVSKNVAIHHESVNKKRKIENLRSPSACELKKSCNGHISTGNSANHESAVNGDHGLNDIHVPENKIGKGETINMDPTVRKTRMATRSLNRKSNDQRVTPQTLPNKTSNDITPTKNKNSLLSSPFEKGPRVVKTNKSIQMPKSDEKQKSLISDTESNVKVNGTLPKTDKKRICQTFNDKAPNVSTQKNAHKPESTEVAKVTTRSKRTAQESETKCVADEIACDSAGNIDLPDAEEYFSPAKKRQRISLVTKPAASVGKRIMITEAHTENIKKKSGSKPKVEPDVSIDPKDLLPFIPDKSTFSDCWLKGIRNKADKKQKYLISKIIAGLNKSTYNPFPEQLSSIASGQLLSHLPEEEKEILRGIQKMQDGVKKKNFIEGLLHVARKEIFNDNEVLGKAALCRIHVVVCRSLGHLEQVRLLCYDIMRLGVTSWGFLVMNILCIWREVLICSFSEKSPLVDTMAFVLMRIGTNFGITLPMVQFLSSEYHFKKQKCGHQKIISDLLAMLKTSVNKDERVVFECMRSIELLSGSQSWMQINNTFIRKMVWPTLKEWSSQQSNPSLVDDVNGSKLENEYIARLLNLIGVVCQSCPVDVSEPVQQVMKTLQALLADKQGDKVAMCVQEAAVQTLVFLQKYNRALVKDVVRKWLPKKQKLISPNLVYLITDSKILTE